MNQGTDKRNIRSVSGVPGDSSLNREIREQPEGIKSITEASSHQRSLGAMEQLKKPGRYCRTVRVPRDRVTNYFGVPATDKFPWTQYFHC